MDPKKIRNFSIIAHIDHGKSTLADRLLLHTGAISKREFRDQILDDMDLERERGITIKARAVRIHYKSYWLNLIDTPGHIDFTYEVSKSLAACEGVLLLVDAGQGIQAQTVTNLYLAMERNLTIIPIITKIDLPTAEPERVRDEVKDFLGIDAKDIIFSSAKTGEGTDEILKAIIDKIPSPKGDPEKPLKALIFDSKFDSYQGVVAYFRVFDGKLHAHDQVLMMQTRTPHEIDQIGIFNPNPEPVEELSAGAVGYLNANIKDISEVKIGDTLTLATNPASEPLPGYQDVKPMVFCGLYPIQAKDFALLRDALAKLRLNDSSFVYEPESSASLGHGYRCGFLGLFLSDPRLVVGGPKVGPEDDRPRGLAGADVDGVLAELEARLGLAVDLRGRLKLDCLQRGVGRGALAHQRDLHQDLIAAVDLGDELDIRLQVAGLVGYEHVLPAQAVVRADGDSGQVAFGLAREVGRDLEAGDHVGSLDAEGDTSGLAHRCRDDNASGRFDLDHLPCVL